MRTPSIGLDQDQEGIHIDKYYGRMPMYLVSIPESDLYECNPEFMNLLTQFMDGTIDNQNMSVELFKKVELAVDALGHYGKFPMPHFDPLFKCMGFTPQPPAGTVFVTVDEQYNGAVFWTADRQPFVVL